jgi:hypothetical protein
MPVHKFKVGQSVRLSPNVFNRNVAGVYEVVAALPEERGEFSYRIKSAEGGQQRIAMESQLAPVLSVVQDRAGH